MRIARTAIDLGLLALAYAAAFFIRFDTVVPPESLERMLVTLPAVVGVKYFALAATGVTQASWRYVSLRDVIRIYVALAASSGLLLLIRFGVPLVNDGAPITQVTIPAGVILIDFVLATLLVGGVRAARRLISERSASRSIAPAEKIKRTVLVGAGQAGVMVARELASRPDLGIEPVGFVDDDPNKVGTVVHGIPVLGRTEHLAVIADRKGATQALITMANVPGVEVRRITGLAEDAGLETKIIPGVYEIVGGQVNLSRIRPVDIEDLLGREPVDLEEDTIAEFVRDRAVMVTGAGGSIGSELCRQLARFAPRSLVLVDRAENNLFEIETELRDRHPELDMWPIVADICDRPRVRWLFARHRPAVVFHAAAHKHVPLMEGNPGEAIKNNVLATKALADIAHNAKVDSFVMVSTDKAVNPTSVMGASKRAASMYTQALGAVSSTRFVTVRFGNVLDSAGSVVPIFKRQIADGGPVTVTHPEMRRYFMTIPEAAQLVLQAGAMGEGGEIFVLDMGEPVRIVDLAEDLIRLSGLEPGRDIEIVFTGIRPGEKLFEELALDAENAERTRHPKIFIGRTSQPHTREELASKFKVLVDVCDDGIGPDAVRQALVEIVPEYRPSVAVEQVRQEA
ncbi:MAG: polysaccharide biosynthesis protein [Actinobacteria bacterium]|nr:polysaccharide biosynthesis protein [Actinomycetota bacterium]